MTDRYCLVQNNKILEIGPRPKWVFENGAPVTDAVLAVDGYYPVVNSNLGDDFIEKPMTDWVISGQQVIVTYWQIIENKPTYNPLNQKIILNPQNKWITTPTQILKTYSLHTCTEEEAKVNLQYFKVVDQNLDTHQYVEKPIQEWNFENGIVYKTYWQIIDDPLSNDFPEVLYLNVLREQFQWIRETDTIQKVYNRSERPIEEIKVNLKDYLAGVRWSIETGGIEWEDMYIHTDRESQFKLLTAFIGAINNIITSPRNWKTKTGFQLLTPEQLQNLGLVSENFVQEVYDKEEEIITMIDDADSFEELKDLFSNILNKDWPSIALFLKEQ